MNHESNGSTIELGRRPNKAPMEAISTVGLDWTYEKNVINFHHPPDLMVLLGTIKLIR